MITDADKAVIVELAGRYKAKKVLLFGSSAMSSDEAGDIDLAVDGVPPSEFFRFYADLLLGLSKPVDLIDLAGDSKFTFLVRRDGVPLYG
jgi:predicted nucleotidyltransferase